MNQFTITRRLEIDMAHRVPHHGSKCFNLHGHRYVIEATVRGPVVESGGVSEQEGMVIDFGFIKEAMVKVIHDPHDHGTTFWHQDPMWHAILMADESVSETRAMLGLQKLQSTPGWKVFTMNEVPTAENLARLWFERLSREIYTRKRSNGEPYLDHSIHHMVMVQRVDVWETPNCVASYPFFNPRAQ